MTEFAFHEFARHARSRALHDRARCRRSLASALIHEFPEYYKLVRAEGVRLERHHAAEPQRPALARPDRRRRQDGSHRDRGLLPDHLGQARWHAPGQRGARHRLDARARGRERRAAQLRLQLLRDQARLRRGPAAHERARLEGKHRRSGSRCKRDLYVTSQRGHVEQRQGGVRAAGDDRRAAVARTRRSARRSIVVDGAPVAALRPLSRRRTCRPPAFFGRAWDSMRL